MADTREEWLAEQEKRKKIHSLPGDLMPEITAKSARSGKLPKPPKTSQQTVDLSEDGNGGDLDLNPKPPQEKAVPAVVQRAASRIVGSRPLVKDKPDGTSNAEKIQGKPYYTQEALLKVINLLFDPLTIALVEEAGIGDEGYLLSLTRIYSSREAWHWATEIGQEAFQNPNRTWSISKIIRCAFLLARRSIGMQGFLRGIDIAAQQTLVKDEAVGEEADL